MELLKLVTSGRRRLREKVSSTSAALKPLTDTSAGGAMVEGGVKFRPRPMLSPNPGKG